MRETKLEYLVLSNGAIVHIRGRSAVTIIEGRRIAPRSDAPVLRTAATVEYLMATGQSRACHGHGPTALMNR